MLRKRTDSFRVGSFLILRRVAEYTHGVIVGATISRPRADVGIRPYITALTHGVTSWLPLSGELSSDSETER